MLAACPLTSRLSTRAPKRFPAVRPPNGDEAASVVPPVHTVVRLFDATSTSRATLVPSSSIRVTRTLPALGDVFATRDREMIPRLNLGTVPAPCRTRRRSHRDARPSAFRSAVCRTSPVSYTHL